MFDNQIMEVDDDDNMTMDSQSFHTRMSLIAKQPLPPLSETTWTPGHRTPGQFSDMESIHGHTETVVAWHGRQALEGGRQLQEEPTWHRGDGRISDMSEGSFDESSIIRRLSKKRSAAKKSSIHHSAENAAEDTGNWAVDERLYIQNMQASTASRVSETTAPENTARQSVQQAAEHSATVDNENIAFHPSLKSSASEDSPVTLKQYERKHKRLSTTAAEKDIPVAIKPRMDSKSQSSRSQGHVELMPEESLVPQQIANYGQGLDRQEPSLQHRMVNDESRMCLGLQARDGFISHGIERETLLSASDDNTESMDITRALNDRAPQHSSVLAKSSDSAKSFLWVDKDHSMDMFDVDVMEKYPEGITEAMPKLDSVLGVYHCDSPSAEPLNRTLQINIGIPGEDSPVYGVTAEIDIKKALLSRKDDDVARSGGAQEKEIVSNRGLEEDTDEVIPYFNNGKKRNGFQNPEDTFSFRGHQKSIREASVSASMEEARGFFQPFFFLV